LFIAFAINIIIKLGIKWRVNLTFAMLNHKKGIHWIRQKHNKIFIMLKQANFLSHNLSSKLVMAKLSTYLNGLTFKLLNKSFSLLVVFLSDMKEWRAAFAAERHKTKSHMKMMSKYDSKKNKPHRV